jgi:hypothetical protein
MKYIQEKKQSSFDMVLTLMVTETTLDDARAQMITNPTQAYTQPISKQSNTALPTNQCNYAA